MTPKHRLLTAQEVADRLATSAETVRRWHRESLLDGVVLPSGQVRFRPEDIDALIARRAS